MSFNSKKNKITRKIQSLAAASQSEDPNQAKGFTLVELLVAMVLFVVLSVIATGGFLSTLRTQRSIVSLIDANNNASLTLEQMAREMRTGFNFSLVSPKEIQFTNAYGNNVDYRLIVAADGTGSIQKSDSSANGGSFLKITSDTINVTNLKFSLIDLGVGFPPRITINLTIAPINVSLSGVSTVVQTTVSARNF